MSETATTIPPKGLWRIRVQDFIKGLWLAVSSGVLALGYFVMSNHFKLPTMAEAEPYLQAIGAGFLTYIGKNLGTNNVGEFLQKDKPVVIVDKEHLETLTQKAK